MAELVINLDTDIEARVKAFAEGCGVPLDELIERAIVFSLRSRYPDNELPGPEAPVDPDYDVDAGLKPDNTLPGRGLCPVFDPTVDNELPEAPVPEPK